MAPREATGAFPDQYLTFEYDTSAAIGVLPPPPPTAAPQPQQQAAAAAAPHDAQPPQQQENSLGGGLALEGGVTSGMVSTRGSAQTNSEIDPLSIDPTSNMITTTATIHNNGNNHHHHHHHTTTIAGMTTPGSPTTPTTSFLPRLSQNSVLPWPTTLAASSSSSSSMGIPPTVGGMSSPSSLPVLERAAQISPVSFTNLLASSSSSSSSSSGSPMGLSSNNPIPVEDGTTDPPVLVTSNPSPLLLFNASPPLAQHQQQQQQQPSRRLIVRRRPSANLRSVLDNSTSMESDDEDDDEIPGLDRTFDSGASSSFAHLVTDEEGETSLPPVLSSASSTGSSDDSLGLIHRQSAFDMANHDKSVPPPPPMSPNTILLSFGPNTTVSDLKYFAERGCIVALLQALTTPRLVTLGTRMLADYAKMAERRVAVASNRRILEFLQRTMLSDMEGPDWLGREYAVETVRSLTATEESDKFLMGTPKLLQTLALVARGGPFAQKSPLASEKARLHACIAVMNLSCGKANKIEIAKVSEVLEAARDVMLHSENDEARLKATTCVKNLSNADANDAALLGTPGLVEALGHVAATTCTPSSTLCTTNACLALMNLSISKSNKHRVFRTPGVMDALMTVLERTTQGNEARIKSCSALSNLAIGYDNKIPMFHYPGFVDAVLNVIRTDTGEARTKACSILWSFAAEMKNQVPVVQRGDILPVLVRVAEEDGTTEARFKCVAALTLLAESLENAIPLLESGALAPLMDILHEAGSDPTQWKGQTASWCVGFLMNIAQSDEAVQSLREAGVVELLAPLLTLDHYQSLKAAMAVTFVCRYDEGDETYDLLRKTENVIPKIISLLHNTLSGRGGNGYKYGVFTLRSSVGCIAALASGPDFMKERIATAPVYESLLRVVADFCVDGGTPGAIVGGGRDDTLSATLAVRALQSLTAHLIPVAGSSALPFGRSMEERLLTALEAFEDHAGVLEETRRLATDAKKRIQGGQRGRASSTSAFCMEGGSDVDMGDVGSLTSHCCGLDALPGMGEEFLQALTYNEAEAVDAVSSEPPKDKESERGGTAPVRTFLLVDAQTGRRFAVPTERSGGRAFNDSRRWCYRRGRFCQRGEEPDPSFCWNDDLQRAYEDALRRSREV